MRRTTNPSRLPVISCRKSPRRRLVPSRTCRLLRTCERQPNYNSASHPFQGLRVPMTSWPPFCLFLSCVKPGGRDPNVEMTNASSHLVSTLSHCVLPFSEVFPHRRPLLPRPRVSGGTFCCSSCTRSRAFVCSNILDPQFSAIVRTQRCHGTGWPR